ncbi:MAG: SDR family oxidoreductase [Gemmatimonadaceae bacterium]|nr:SDR family oxidoreductase [Gemmatimonadaceae bacterium]
MTATALITGATSGIGLEFARQLAARGCAVTLVARDLARLDAVAAQLRETYHVAVTILQADLATAEGVEHVESLIAGHQIDVLVNNAGFGTRGPLARTAPEAQRAMVHLHVTATNRLTMAVLPGMVARGHGAIITVSSVASYTTSANNVNYCATKAYQRVLMESLSLEVAGSGVHVQALCPGFTRTEFHDRAAMRMERIPAWLWLNAGDVVRASLAAMDAGGPSLVIPGRRWRAIVALIRHLPRRLLRRQAQSYQRTREESR